MDLRNVTVGSLVFDLRPRMIIAWLVFFTVCLVPLVPIIYFLYKAYKMFA